MAMMRGMFYNKFQNKGREWEGIWFDVRYQHFIEKYPHIHAENEVLFFFKVEGNNYQERKASAHDLAVEWSYLVGETNLSYQELTYVSDFFVKVGKRYGLLTEFRENGIC